MGNLIKHSTIVIYDCRVVLTRKLPMYITTLELLFTIIKMFIRLATVGHGPWLYMGWKLVLAIHGPSSVVDH